MTLVNTATGELAESITEADVDASIGRVFGHSDSIFDELAWQVENETWTIKHFESWDEMREVVYAKLIGVRVPRAQMPELVARFRGAGLTQTQTAETLGISRPTVARHDSPTYMPREANVSNDTFVDDPEVIDAEIVEDEPAFVPSVPVPEGGDPGEYESSCHVDPSGGVNDLKQLLAGWDKYLANYYVGPSGPQLDVIAEWLGKHQRKTERARRNTK